MAFKERIKFKYKEFRNKLSLLCNFEQICRLLIIRCKIFSKRRYLSVFLDTNNVCNLACKYCHWSIKRSGHNKKPIFLSLQGFEKIAEQVFPLTQSLSLACNAEPLLTKNFIGYVRIAKKYKVPKIAFVTNGTLFNKQLIENCVLEKVDLIYFSIDAANPDTYEEIRGGDLNKILRSLEMFQNLKSELSSDLPVIQINYTVFDRNVDELPLFIKRYSHLFQQINIGSLINQDNLPPYHRLSKTEYNATINLAYKLCKKLGVLFSAGYIKKKSETNPWVCFQPYIYRNINSQGELRSCSDEIMGDLFADSYKKIIDRNREKIFKLSFLNGKACQICW